MVAILFPTGPLLRVCVRQVLFLSDGRSEEWQEGTPFQASPPCQKLGVCLSSALPFLASTGHASLVALRATVGFLDAAELPSETLHVVGSDYAVSSLRSLQHMSILLAVVAVDVYALSLAVSRYNWSQLLAKRKTSQTGVFLDGACIIPEGLPPPFRRASKGSPLVLSAPSWPRYAT